MATTSDTLSASADQRQTSPTLGRRHLFSIAAAAIPIQLEVADTRDAELLATGVQLLSAMKAWETNYVEDVTREAEDNRWNGYLELTWCLREKLNEMEPQTLGGVHVKLLCALFDDDLDWGLQAAIADRTLSEDQYNSLSWIQTRVWDLAKAIEKMPGFQTYNHGTEIVQ